ncbi:MAG: fructosamine kinase family protein [Gammaproteobacteria bacterium]|nr:fructosamine kinase family protein [Gammaproteobacteria bacterium]
MSIWPDVAEQISAATGKPFAARAVRTRGSALNATAVVEDGERMYFVKHNTADRIGMLRAEAAGLDELAGTHTLLVVRPICCGISGTQAFLVLEHADLADRNDTIDADLGRGLAALHAQHRDHFGWRQDNTIGTTPQSNQPTDDWPAFWAGQRLAPQLAIAADQGYTGRVQDQGAALLARVRAFFPGHGPAPSLVHGDLWSGNAAACGGRAIVYDPAVYYGDRETDLAMTELFGGFSPAFYAAYAACYPLDPGYQVRKTLYNLYHVLNHLNLFGGGYLGQAERMMARLLTEVGT